MQEKSKNVATLILNNKNLKEAKRYPLVWVFPTINVVLDEEINTEFNYITETPFTNICKILLYLQTKFFF